MVGDRAPAAFPPQSWCQQPSAPAPRQAALSGGASGRLKGRDVRVLGELGGSGAGGLRTFGSVLDRGAGAGCTLSGVRGCVTAVLWQLLRLGLM